MLCAWVPAATDAPTTEVFNDQVLISWNEAVPHGATVTEYKIFIRQHGTEEVLVVAPGSCDGTDEQTINEYYCWVSLFDLIEPPYNLVKGEEIQVSIVATNSYGDSDYSPLGNGALTQLVPDAPINLTRDEDVTDADVIRFTWTEGLSDGGTPVLDYDVYWD
jgi:hypothetical protein